jgi:hypothetical protein
MQSQAAAQLSEKQLVHLIRAAISSGKDLCAAVLCVLKASATERFSSRQVLQLLKAILAATSF